MTEDDVRRIVREEIARQDAETAHSLRVDAVRRLDAGLIAGYVVHDNGRVQEFSSVTQNRWVTK